MASNIEERIKLLEQRQQRLKEQEKALRAKKSEEERKARTRRLIKVGAAVEHVFGRAIDSDELLEEVLQAVRRVKNNAYG